MKNNFTQIEKAIIKTIENKQIIRINNIVLNSLAAPGGTIEHREVEIFLENNYFDFKNGFYMFIPSSSSVFLNYCKKPLQVVTDQDFTYKVTKTKIKAINGFLGLKKHIKENSKISDTFFFLNNSILKNYDLKYKN